jgi:hypothetical protein
MEVTEGGLEVRRRNASGGQHGFWAGKTCFRGKHRTEVMEVTEGGLEVGEISTLRTAWLVSGNNAKEGKHRTEVTEGGIEGWREYPRYGQHGLLAGNDAKAGKHRTEVTEGGN